MTLLAAFRGADGRSLARALSVLLIVSGWLGAFHSVGVFAATDLGLCVANGGSSADPASPARPVDQDHRICCILGCAATAQGVLAGADGQLDAEPMTESVGKPAGTPVSNVVLRPATASPRGPPRLA